MSRRLQAFFVLLSSLVGSLSLVSFLMLYSTTDSARKMAWPLAIIFWVLVAVAGLIVLYWDELQAADAREKTARHKRPGDAGDGREDGR